MIPNQSSINFENLKPMMIQRHADLTKFGTINFEIFDDDLMNMMDEEINHELVEEIIVGDWVHVDCEGFIPNPELDKALWELTKLYAKYDIEEEG